MAMRLLGFMVVLVDRGRWDGMAELALAMMKVVPEDQPFNWLPQGLGNHNQESHRPSTSNSRCLNSLYDPAYEEMGLPIDPHLRLFLASMNQDKGKCLF
ncbi:hypothetical protein CK203_022611 [Vitis vinifera]|uniref:Uncharacterized protein n=1 Tax=Vitis vinifera TaxID=29760 RepID=A0A438JE28_VITVI|nr:hypothetical protein CK203_022611 [Vitis vinifera]